MSNSTHENLVGSVGLRSFVGLSLLNISVGNVKEARSMSKLILNYTKEDGTYLRDHEVMKSLRELLDWFLLPLESDLREDYHPCTDFGAEYIENLHNPNDLWKNYTFSDEWLINVSQVLIIDCARLLYRSGEFKNIELIIMENDQPLVLDKAGRCYLSPDRDMKFSRDILENLARDW